MEEAKTFRVRGPKGSLTVIFSFDPEIGKSTCQIKHDGPPVFSLSEEMSDTNDKRLLKRCKARVDELIGEDSGWTEIK